MMEFILGVLIGIMIGIVFLYWLFDKYKGQ